ncbi:translation initiation factor IF-2-like [Canis lupus familiaris]|uniref:translation initiation factor IF-2-like n=1 Tax=Canis lupus familiaris TaxID=9615 RepID=UPI0015F17759|nr:translation initiation factor IF-2-like [Canis lupus familiaris]XP_038540476.1 translation initiation factor IF-2-like [Canis lupus familiaris]XP_038544792.1 translation initiation factor IF-2-like [Canis lupus familiaris]
MAESRGEAAWRGLCAARGSCGAPWGRGRGRNRRPGAALPSPARTRRCTEQKGKRKSPWRRGPASDPPRPAPPSAEGRGSPQACAPGAGPGCSWHPREKQPLRRRPGSVPPPRGSARNCRPRGRAAPAAPPPPGLRRPATEFKATGASQPRGAPQSFPEAPAVPAPGPYPRELPLRGEGPLVRPVPPPRPRAREPHGNQLPTGAHPHRLGRLPGPRCLALSGLPRGPHLSDLSCGPDPTALQVGSSVALWLESALPFTARAGRWRVFWLRLPSRFSGILIPVRTKIWCWRGGPFQASAPAWH